MDFSCGTQGRPAAFGAAFRNQDRKFEKIVKLDRTGEDILESPKITKEFLNPNIFPNVHNKPFNIFDNLLKIYKFS